MYYLEIQGVFKPLCQFKEFSRQADKFKGFSILHEPWTKDSTLSVADPGVSIELPFSCLPPPLYKLTRLTLAYPILNPPQSLCGMLTLTFY